MHCCAPKQFAIVSEKDAVFGTAEAVRLLQNRIKHRREIARRRIDHLQYLGGRGLLLQSLARFGPGRVKTPGREMSSGRGVSAVPIAGVGMLQPLW